MIRVLKPGSQRFVAIILAIFLLTNFISPLYVFSYETDPDLRSQTIRKIEASIYDPDYSNCAIYTRKDGKDGLITYDKLRDNSGKTIVTLRCPYSWDFASNETDYKEIIVDKSKIITSYGLYFEIAELNEIESGAISVYDFAQKHDAMKRQIIFAKDKEEPIYYYMDSEVFPQEQYITLDFISDFTVKETMHDLIWKPQVWEELKKSDLDLRRTKAIVAYGFNLFPGIQALLFYDGTTEYFMSLKSTTYSLQDTELEEYRKPEEKIERTLEAFKLYEIKTDLAPYIKQQLIFQNMLLERMENAG